MGTIVICEGWDAAMAALPEGYTLDVHVNVNRSRGYVKYEPPARPGNRGPRKPRFVEGFGWIDGPPNIGAALMLLAQKPSDA